MSDTALPEQTWLERAKAVNLPTTERADATRKRPEALAAILELLSQGASYKAAAQANGVEYRTFKRWREQDQTLETLCQEALATAYAVREVNIATDKNWKAQVAWLSARKHVFADPDWTAQERQQSQGITVNITVRQDDTPTLVDVTPETPVLDQDAE